MEADVIKEWLFEQRYRTLLPVTMLGILLVTAGMGKIQTKSPISGKDCDAEQLQIEFDNIMRLYEYAGKDLKEQIEQRDKISSFINTLANGQVTNWGGVMNLALSTGLFTAFLNLKKKNDVIASLKNGRSNEAIT